MTGYSGIGYPGPINTQGPNPIQDHLHNVGSGIATDLAGIMAAEAGRLGASASLAGDFIATTGFPRNLEDFIISFRKYIYSVTPPTPPLPTDPNAPLDPRIDPALIWSPIPGTGGGQNAQMANALLNGFLNHIDSNALTALGFTQDDLQTLFSQVFTNFASKFIFDPTKPNKLAEFRDSYQEYFTRFAKITEASTIDPAVQLSYEVFYNAFIDPSINANPDFANDLKAFIIKYVNEGEGFNPSTFFDKWTEDALAKYTLALSGSSSTVTSSVGATSKKTMILGRIFKLLVEMISALQTVAAAQSDRLKFFTDWNRAYTDLQNNVKYIIKGDPIELGNDDGLRNDYNSLNATFVEQIKARKSLVTDDSKNLQTTINQSTDSVNQQTSMATSILQELSAILSAIYR